MSITASKINSILEEDILNIYLGNLSTVDNDLHLPKRGKNGSVFSWSSSAEHLLSTEGKVLRQHYGAGNRKVILTVTAEYEGMEKSREFLVNILEREHGATITYAYDIEVITLIGNKPELPMVAIAKNNLDEDEVVSVVWEDISNERYNKKGEYYVFGKVKDDVCVRAAIAVIENKNLLNPQIDSIQQVKSFSYDDTSLCEGSEFYDALKETLDALINMNDDTMLYNFRDIAGIDTKGAEKMTGWDAPECNLKGHTTGHYLSSLSLAYATTKNEIIYEKLNYMIEELYKCQKNIEKRNDCKEGFISAYNEVQFDLLEKYTPYPVIWSPYYTLHKIIAGFRDAYKFTHNKKALEMYIGLGNWIHSRLSKISKIHRQNMWALYIAGEFGGMKEVMVNLYSITGDEKYLITAKYFDNERLYLPMKMNIDTLGNIHANQHIPQIVGALEHFSVTGEKNYYIIAYNFWEMVVKNHTYSFGGVGEAEMFKHADKIGNFLSRQTAESCASYNMLKLTAKLFMFNPDSRYMDYYERTIFNHILASRDICNDSGAGSIYFMDTRPGGVKQFDYWENSCCQGTGLESHFKYQENIFFHNDYSLFINFYIPSELKWKDKKTYVKMKSAQGKENIQADISIETEEIINLKLRKPYWAEDIKVYINGNQTNYSIDCGYINIFSLLGNVSIRVELPCRAWMSRTPDKPELFSVCWGPYVLAALSDENKFLEADVNEKNINSKLEVTGVMEYKLNDIKFIPLFRINKTQKYHIYIKNFN